MFKPDLKSLPKNPGVYIYKNNRREIIYIGKAKNLKNRISSYFSSKHEHSPKTQFLVKNIDYLEYIIVNNEVEALLLENKLIKKHKPKYNIDLKDSKTYAYIKITDEEIPKIISTRQITKKGHYFGPFTNGQLKKELIELTVSLFKIITPYTYSSKSTLYHDIGLAPASKEKLVNKDEYRTNVKEAIEFLKGKKRNKLIKKLREEIKQLSKEKRFEEAMIKKKQIDAIEYLNEKQTVDMIKEFDQDVIAFVLDKKSGEGLIEVLHVGKGVLQKRNHFNIEIGDDTLEEFIKIYYSKNSIPREILISEIIWESEKDKEILEKYLSNLRKAKVTLTNPQKGEKKSLLDIAIKNAKEKFKDKNILIEMKNKLNLPKIPKTIECFDMSNLGKKHLVGGMTRWVNQKPDKDNYRRFEIKSFSGKNDDFTSMKEVIYRRYKGIKEKREMGGEYPDLIIVDGGKGQLNAALESLNKLNLKIPIISLAKKEEEIFLPNCQDSLKIPKNSKMMLYIRQIRDSVHNYVVSYNRKKRSMELKN